MLQREQGSIPGGFLCDEMGLGKTLQVIEVIRRNQLKHTLIIVPKSIVKQWFKEFQKFASDVSVHCFDGSDRTWDMKTVVIVPYSLVEHIPLGQKWNRIVLDEGHEIRNPKSKTHKTIRSLCGDIRWVVSGTPVFNSMRDFVSLCGFIGITPGTVARSTDEVRKKYVLRRTKELASKITFENIELDMSGDEQNFYKEAFLAGQGILKHGVSGLNSMVVIECLLRVRQTMIWPQLYIDGIALKNGFDPELYSGVSNKHLRLVEEIQKHPDEKTLVFTQFTGETDKIQEMLAALHIPVFRLDGQVSKEERERRIDCFRTSESNAVFLIQIKAGGVGLNLQEASRVYIMSPAWNPATELQAIGRSHRTGQTRAVVVKKFIYKAISEDFPSIEQSIVSLQMTKARICADVLADEAIAYQVPGICPMTLRTIAKLFKTT